MLPMPRIQMKSFVSITLVLCFCIMSKDVRGAGQGIEIQSDADGKFHYTDDFQRPKFLADAFCRNLSEQQWESGALTNAGPNRHRKLIYRFFGDQAISELAVTVVQSSNAANLGGVTTLALSRNGLDWETVDSSAAQPAEANGFQNGVLQAPAEKKALFLGGSELWICVTMDNHSGLAGNISNYVRGISVALEVKGDAAAAAADGDHAQWNAVRQAGQWQEISLDVADRRMQSPPHYYEDLDGYLAAQDQVPGLKTADAAGMIFARKWHLPGRYPVSFAGFVQCGAGALAARITALTSENASRRVEIRWDGIAVKTIDTGSFFEQEKTFYVAMTCSTPGLHELRIVPLDQQPVTITSIHLAGGRDLHWAAKPAVPAGTLQITSASYLPDPLPPAASQTVEGTIKEQMLSLVFEELQNMLKGHEQFGALRLTVLNPNNFSLRIVKVYLNDKPIEASHVDFVKDSWDARGVVWYRVHPLTVPSKGGSEVYIRFRKRLEGREALVKLELENGQFLETSVVYERPSFMLDYITTGNDGRTLYVYVRPVGYGIPPLLEDLVLDTAVLDNVKWYGKDWQSRMVLAVAELPKPLEMLNCHIVAVNAEDGTTAAAGYRVMKNIFPRSSVYVPLEDLAKYHMNIQTWYEKPLEQCEKYQVYTSSIEPYYLDLHERVIGVYGPDEPDAHDNQGGGWEKGLGWWARQLSEAGWQAMVQRYSPHTATWLIMDGTTRPLNWFVYGQMADTSCFDPYPVTYYGADHAYVRESLQLARLAGLPRRMFGCLEAYGWRSGQGVPGDARGPVPGEYRQNVVQALGCGMKGLNSWVYPNRFGGWEGNEAFAAVVTAMNQIIEKIEQELLLATPVDWAVSDAGTVMTGTVKQELAPKDRVWVGGLLSGPDTLILAVANHIPASKTAPEVIEPAKNVTITVDLPEYLRGLKAYEVLPDGLHELGCQEKAGKLLLFLNEITDGRVFILKKNEIPPSN